MADDDDYDGGYMDNDDAGDDEPIEDVDPEQADEDGERIQLVEVRRFFTFSLLNSLLAFYSQVNKQLQLHQSA